MDIKLMAKEMRVEADKLLKAAEILDPQKAAAKSRKKTRSDKGKPRAPKTPTSIPERIAAIRDSKGEATTLDLGTAGRTSHPSDPDAQAIANDLVHTEG